MYIVTSNKNYTRYRKGEFDTVVEFPHNYSVILRHRIQRKLKNNIDLEKGQMMVTINLIGKITLHILIKCI